MSAIELILTRRRISFSIAGVWLALSALLIMMLLRGITPNSDFDDLMKLHEIRHLLQTGNPFDRTLPGISQPEPVISHWPWIVDAPYALVAAATAPLSVWKLPFLARHSSSRCCFF